MTELISVIVTTYNREDVLGAVLRAGAPERPPLRSHHRRRRLRPGDARSRRAQSAHFAVPIQHVWHEDRGFRAGEIRNRGLWRAAAAIASSSTAIAFARAASCGPSPAGGARLVPDRQPGAALARTDRTGSRLAAEPERGASIDGSHCAGRTESIGWRRFCRCRLGRCESCGRGVARRTLVQPRGWRCDLDRVNGFDASYSGWGLEDSDLMIRLLHAGVRRKDGNFATGVLHLWHQEDDRASLPQNQRRLDEIEHRIASRDRGVVTARYGNAVGGDE